MALLYATSRVFHGENPAGALHQGDTKVWEPVPAVPWTPVSVPGLFVWLDATQVVAADGDPVPTWLDASGNRFDAQQIAGSAVAVYRTDGINGHPAIRFGEYGLVQMDVVHDGRTMWDRTIFQVVKEPLASQFGAFHSIQLQSLLPYLQTYGTSTILTYADPEVASPVAWSDEAQLITVWANSFDGSQGLEVDGVLSTAGWNPTGSSSPFWLAGNLPGGYGMCGFIGELIIYERCLTFSERDDVMNYLRTKWELP